MERIFLIGYMGSGKTTLGKALAQKLGLSFVDLDWYIEERLHKTINELFAEKGEANFRELEKKMLHEVADFENVVIATGGGTPCFFDNMDFMNSCGKTVFLDTNIDVLFQRLAVAKHTRPILKNKTNEELLAFIDEALKKRLPKYKCAKYTYNSEKLDNRQQIKTSVEQLIVVIG
ncbi:shikimate kinase [Bacteroides sp. 519]|uniref:shikimate kinase n=1 Tax=Bacteroides sp. 519 TaxID=2302937 RepID=UPI0013D86FAE|nr:shikimate kinase [Bacteroides sp. 519]NDV58093.1 shikimate kinase [Bacteroides sp. 519]